MRAMSGVERREMREILLRLLELHRAEGAQGGEKA